MTKAEIRSQVESGIRLIPHHMREGVRLYLETGIMTGSFQNAVMAYGAKSNEAWIVADMVNRSSVGEWEVFLAKHMPADAHGSPLKVSAWKKMRGLCGYPDA